MIMALIKLPCLMGDKCEFRTVELEYDQAKQQLDGHMQYAHGAEDEYAPVGPALVRQLRQQLKSLDETVNAIEANESRELARKTVELLVPHQYQQNQMHQQLQLSQVELHPEYVATVPGHVGPQPQHRDPLERSTALPGTECAPTASRSAILGLSVPTRGGETKPQ